MKLLNIFLWIQTTVALKRFYYFYDSDDKSAFDKYRHKKFLNFGKFRGVVLEDYEYNNPDIDLQNIKYIQDQQIKIIDYHIESSTREDEGLDLWGLDRINEITSELDEKIHNQRTGNNIEVYVIDSGINTNHEELNHNSIMLKDFTNDKDMIDYNGHGTHVAGIIGGYKYGVARNVKIFGLKVFDISGSGSTINIILAMHEVMKRCLHKNKKCIINMSLGGPYQQIYNDIINDMMLHNIVVVVAGGNSNDNACYYTPAAAYLAVTVGATNVKDKRAWFSNFGNCINIYAPGQKIYSAYGESYKYLSGTSMATPFVTGLISHLWSNNYDYNSFEIVDELYLKSNSMLISYYQDDNFKKQCVIISNFEKFIYIEDESLINWIKKIDLLNYSMHINIAITIISFIYRGYKYLY